jgi:phosphoserine phosphatase
VAFATVVFDCDSTLSAIEGVDELAGDLRPRIAALTDAAMRGEVALEAVYGRRLDIIRPTRAQVERVGRRYIDALIPDARAVVAALLEEGITVRVLSGGLRPAILPLLRELGLAADALVAVDIHFDDRGEYAGFDTSSPLTRAGGKREVLERWGAAMPRPVLLVGDGATDLEARPAADAFVAFAGVVARRAVIEAADYVIRAPSLAPVVALALGESPARTDAARALAREGARLLRETHPTSSLTDSSHS